MLGLAKIAIDSLRNITKIMRQSQERLSSARMKDVVISPIQDIGVYRTNATGDLHYIAI